MQVPQNILLEYVKSRKVLIGCNTIPMLNYVCYILFHAMLLVT